MFIWQQKLDRFILGFDNGQTVRVESKLKDLQAPTLIVWGTGDIFFDVKWSHWLADTIPGATRRVEFEGARMLFPEERPEELSGELRTHWNKAL
jgi:pimeloyl-ACP methyl ester carboxylesterase